MGLEPSKNGVAAVVAAKLRTRGLANTYLALRQQEDAALVLGRYLDEFGYDHEFSSLHARALQSSGRRDEALQAFLRHAESDAKGAAASAGAAVNIAITAGQLDVVQRLIDLATEKADADFAARKTEWQNKLERARQKTTDRATLNQRVADLLDRLLVDPASVVAELDDEAELAETPDRLKWIHAQAMMKTADARVHDVLRQLTVSSQAYGKQAGNHLLSLIRKAGGNIGDLTEADVRKLIVERQMAENGGR